MAKKAAKKAAEPEVPAKPAEKPTARKAAKKAAEPEPVAAKAAPKAKAAKADPGPAAKPAAARPSAAKKAAESAAGAAKRPVAAAVIAAGRYQPAAAAPVAAPAAEAPAGRLATETRRPANTNAINAGAFHRPDRDAIRAPYAPRGGYAEPSSEIPHGYNRTRISVLVRDPEWIFAFWDIAEATRAELGLNRAGAMGLMLRLHDVTGIAFNGTNAVSTEDIPVNSGATSWYVHVPTKGRRYVVDLGVLAYDGAFHQIARSQPFDMPRAEVSNDIEWGLNERNEEEHLQILRMSGGTNVPARMSSADFVSQLQSRLLKEGAGFSGGLFSGSLVSGEFASATFIHRAQQEKRGRGFWLVVDAEVIVYGATEPDAKVSFMGRPIKLNPDGTFGIRMALPDGRIDFPVEATSADREETLRVCPIVERETKK